MISHILKRSTRAVLGASVAVGFTLGLPGPALQAQEQDYQLTRDDLETALSQPEQVLEKLRQERGAKQVTFVDVADVLGSEEDATRLREEHAEGIRTFQSALREEGAVTEALGRQLESQQYRVEDVVAVHVESGAPEAGGGEEGEEPSKMAAHETVFVVVSGPGSGASPDARPDSVPRDSVRR